MLSRPVTKLAVTAVSAVMALTAAGCTAEPPSPSTSESALPGNIPANRWNQGTPDLLQPVGLAGIKPTEPLVATSYDEGTDTIGDWRLMDINDDRTKLVIQYSQGGPCDRGLLHIASSAPVWAPTGTLPKADKRHHWQNREATYEEHVAERGAWKPLFEVLRFPLAATRTAQDCVKRWPRAETATPSW